MKKRSAKIALLLLTVCVLALAVFLGVRTMTRDYVIQVNGSPVLEEEFEMLLAENTQQYEGELRVEYQIPPEQSVEDFLGGEVYREQMARHHIQYVAALRVEQELARECGIIETFTYEKLLKTVEMENQTRGDKIAKGEVVYGLQSFSVPQYYSYFMSNLESELLRALQNRLPVTAEDVEAYYEGMDSYANVTGEIITYTLYDTTQAQVLPEESQQKLFDQLAGELAAGTDREITAEGTAYRAQRRDFTPRELRDFIRQGFQENALGGMKIGEVSEPFSLGGVWYLARYDGFARTEKLEDNDRDVLEHTLRQRKYDALIKQETARADIVLNNSRLERCMEEEAAQTTKEEPT